MKNIIKQGLLVSSLMMAPMIGMAAINMNNEESIIPMQATSTEVRNSEYDDGWWIEDNPFISADLEADYYSETVTLTITPEAGTEYWGGISGMKKFHNDSLPEYDGIHGVSQKDVFIQTEKIVLYSDEMSMIYDDPELHKEMDVWQTSILLGRPVENLTFEFDAPGISELGMSNIKMSFWSTSKLDIETEEYYWFDVPLNDGTTSIPTEEDWLNTPDDKDGIPFWTILGIALVAIIVIGSVAVLIIALI